MTRRDVWRERWFGNGAESIVSTCKQFNWFWRPATPPRDLASRTRLATPPHHRAAPRSRGGAMRRRLASPRLPSPRLVSPRSALIMIVVHLVFLHLLQNIFYGIGTNAILPQCLQKWLDVQRLYSKSPIFLYFQFVDIELSLYNYPYIDLCTSVHVCISIHV